MHKSLYRKYRPQAFFDVVGQEHITATLKNEIISGKVAHAYLFTGTRGTGKTSCAKIFAKAINCKNPKNGNPCNECEICKGIASGEIMDIIEIDAASNNGVDDVRELREDVIYSPSVSNYKVYIIDEVHMLSTAAFNALLKTLEEPPAHVIFILATTEINKVPTTVLSRCQRFDFRRLTVKEISARLSDICRLEGIEADADAVTQIARLGDGSVRDAISILDQCAGAGERLTRDYVDAMTQSTGKETLFELYGAVAASDYASVISTLASLYYSSKDFTRLTEDLIAFLRDLMVVKETGGGEELVICSEVDMKKFAELAKRFSFDDILRFMEILQGTLEKMPRAVNKRISVELAFLKMIRGCDDGVKEKDFTWQSPAPAAVKSAPAPVKSAAEEPPFTPDPAPEKASEKAPEPKAEKDEKAEPDFPPFDYDKEPEPPFEESVAEAPAEEKAAEEKSTAEDVISAGFYDRWNEIVSKLKEHHKMSLWSLLIGSSAVRSGDKLIIKTKNAALIEMLGNVATVNEIASAAKEVTGEALYAVADDGAKKEPDDRFTSWLESNKNDIDIV